MKLLQALRVFWYLLGSGQWYIVAEDKYKRSHLIDGNINIGQLKRTVNNSIDEAVNGEILLHEAKELLKVIK